MRNVRHMTNSAQPPLSYNNPANIIRSDVLPSGQTDQRRVEERKRNPGPLVNTFFTWLILA